MPHCSFARQPYQYYCGFTIIEILACISLVSILAALLFPIFSIAREKARRNVCQNNLQKIGFAMLQYTQDYDERLPRNDSGVRGQGCWVETLQPYTKSDQIFLCPTDTHPLEINAQKLLRTSYALNQIYCRDREESLFEANLSGFTPMLLANIEDAAGTIAVGDASDYYQVFPHANNNFIKIAIDANPPWVGDGGVYGKFVGRHQRGTNWLFLDGHVKWMGIEALEKRSVIAPEELAFLTPTLD